MVGLVVAFGKISRKHSTAFSISALTLVPAISRRDALATLL